MAVRHSTKSRAVPKVRIARPKRSAGYSVYATRARNARREIRISTGPEDIDEAERQKTELEAKLLLGIDAKPNRTTRRPANALGRVPRGLHPAEGIGGSSEAKRRWKRQRSGWTSARAWSSRRRTLQDMAREAGNAVAVAGRVTCGDRWPPVKARRSARTVRELRHRARKRR